MTDNALTILGPCFGPGKEVMLPSACGPAALRTDTQCDVAQFVWKVFSSFPFLAAQTHPGLMKWLKQTDSRLVMQGCQLACS